MPEEERHSFDDLMYLLDHQGYQIVLNPNAHSALDGIAFPLLGASAAAAHLEPDLADHDLVYDDATREYYAPMTTICLREEDQDRGKQFREELRDLGSEGSRYLFRAENKAVIVVDIAQFTQYSMVEQCLAVSTLLSWIEEIEHPMGYEFETEDDLPVNDRVPTGDGCALILEDSYEACLFASRLGRVFEDTSRKPRWGELHYRMGIDYGPLYVVRDARQAWNYVGDAINKAHRVLSTIGQDMDDVIYVSDRVYRASPIKKPFIPMGRRRDKHGEMHRVYHLNHYGFHEVKRLFVRGGDEEDGEMFAPEDEPTADES